MSYSLQLHTDTDMLKRARLDPADPSLGESGKPPFWVPDDFTFDLDHFSIPEHYAPDLGAVMLPHGMIMDRVEKIAVDIIKAYKFSEAGTRITMLCVLKGGHQFFSDLCNALKRLTLTGVEQPPLTFDFIRVKSYQDTESSGDVKIESIGVDLKSLAGRHVLLVEDIIDTGTTMAMLVPYLKGFGPATVRVATLLQKRTPKSNGFEPDYSGFSIPDKFVVGYCLDYNEVCGHARLAPTCDSNARQVGSISPSRFPHPASCALSIGLSGHGTHLCNE